MSEFKSQALSAATARRAATTADLARASTTVFVDVAQEATRAEVSRGGVPLGEIAVLPEAITSFLDALPIIQTKVVTQAIVAGTAVARGTAIDISLANTHDLPVAVVPGVHTAFADLTMAQLNDQWATNAPVRDIVKRRTSADDLTAAERTTLQNAFQAAHVTIDDNNTVDAAFTGIKAAFTFQG
jgi:hypothetical protein